MLRDPFAISPIPFGLNTIAYRVREKVSLPFLGKRAWRGGQAGDSVHPLRLDFGMIHADSERLFSTDFQSRWAASCSKNPSIR